MDGIDKIIESFCEVYYMSIGIEIVIMVELIILKGEVNFFEVCFFFCFLVDFEVFCVWFSCRFDSGSWLLFVNENLILSY